VVIYNLQLTLFPATLMFFIGYFVLTECLMLLSSFWDLLLVIFKYKLWLLWYY